MRRRTVPTVTLAPDEVRHSFERWLLWPPGQTVEEMLAAIDRQAYPARPGRFQKPCLIEIGPAQIDELKLRIAQAVHRLGGEYRTHALVVRSTDGVTFTVSLP
jgi:hypothetical protein